MSYAIKGTLVCQIKTMVTVKLRQRRYRHRSRSGTRPLGGRRS